MKSLRAEMIEEVSNLTTEEMRERLLAAEHLIYVLEMQMKHWKASSVSPMGPDALFGNALYDLCEDEKKARAAYAAAREEKVTFYCCPPSSTCKCNCGTTEPRVCEHKWDGEEEVMAGGSSVTCSKCGMSAMSHDMRCCP